MQHLFSQPESYKEHQIGQARMLREEAQLLPSGAVRDATILAARRAYTAAHLDDWATSPGLQSPT
nr:hypothetical protein [Bradyrhizobium sp. JYMT SZCCT0180]